MGEKNRKEEFISKKLILDMIDRDIRKDIISGNPEWAMDLVVLHRRIVETRGYTVEEILEMNGVGSNIDAGNKES